MFKKHLFKTKSFLKKKMLLYSGRYILSANKKEEDFPIITLNDCAWYHSTYKGNIDNIKKNGFEISFDNPVQYTSGIYLLNDPLDRRLLAFGDILFMICVRGKFLDASEYIWLKFLRQFEHIQTYDKEGNKRLYDAILTKYPILDGVLLDLGANKKMLVIWKTNTIIKIINLGNIKIKIK